MDHFPSYMAGKVMDSLKRFYCALRGHEHYLRFEQKRVYLQCADCGHESPGWNVEPERPVLEFAARRPVATASGAFVSKVA